MARNSKKKHEGNLKARVEAVQIAAAAQIKSLKENTKQTEIRKRNLAGEFSFYSVSHNLAYLYHGRAIRTMATFNRSLKTDDPSKIRLLVAQHLFQKYKVPEFMKECWYVKHYQPSTHYKHLERDANMPRWRRPEVHLRAEESKFAVDNSTESLLQRNWFITAASGGSLYKQHCKEFMTKNEVHAFLTCPLKVNFAEALIYAVASQETKNISKITQIFKSKLSELTYPAWLYETFWRDVIRFYATTEMTFQQMNDLYDYFAHIKVEYARRGIPFEFKGRTLVSLTRDMTDWHHELNRAKKLGNATWEGLPLADIEFKIDNVTWKMTQILTSKELCAEGTSMHHCVYSYQGACVAGKKGIFSLKCWDPKRWHGFVRSLTLEVTLAGDIVQARGVINRAARPDERKAVEFWARHEDLRISSHVFPKF